MLWNCLLPHPSNKETLKIVIIKHYVHVHVDVHALESKSMAVTSRNRGETRERGEGERSNSPAQSIIYAFLSISFCTGSA